MNRLSRKLSRELNPFPNFVRCPASWLALTLSLLLCLNGCSLTPKKDSNAIVEQAVRDQATVSLDKPEETAPYYIRLATESIGEAQRQHLLKAAQLLYLHSGMIDTEPKNVSANKLKRIRKKNVQFLAAKIALANSNPAQTLELLPSRASLTQAEFIAASNVRAQAYSALGYTLKAVATRVEVEPLYKTEAERQHSHEAIWADLGALPSIELARARSDNRIVQGWVELARILRNAQTDISWVQENVLNWGTRFPGHPVNNTFIDRLLNEYLAGYTPGKGIAVMLPMSGPFQAISNTIKNGFISAYYKDGTSETKPIVRFYDTSDENIDFMELYNQAVMEGASHIVGPLEKPIINQLAQKSYLNVPTLTLNYAQDALNETENLYQFGLLPEDEARQAAELAIRQGKLQAAVLVPEGDWGLRIMAAFQQRYEELGGNVLSVQQYSSNVSEYSGPIQRLFNLQHSNARHRSLERVVKTSLKFMPQRRQDIDMIFIAATHRAARSLMPSFKFHHAADLPVYATSHVYTGNIDRADHDLNGLTFCDIPWTLVTDNELKTTFQRNWPEQQGYTRLFALGVDAYHIIRNLNYLQSHDYARFSGETGNISLDENQRMHRELLWAQFQEGKPVYIDTTLAPTTPASSGTNQP